MNNGRINTLTHTHMISSVDSYCKNKNVFSSIFVIYKRKIARVIRYNFIVTIVSNINVLLFYESTL